MKIIISEIKASLLLILLMLNFGCSGGGGGNPGSSADADITPPDVTAPENINVAASSASGTPATDAAIAAFLADAAASDNVDGAVSVTNNALITFPAATTTTVTFSASDTAGNVGAATATVTVGVFSGDTTSPVVTPPANINVAASSASGTPATDAAIETFLADASATDNIDGAVSVTNNAPGTFPAATTTTVTFSASDTAGNIGTATATVTVNEFIVGTPWTGTKQLGVAGADTAGLAVAIDANGNVYVAGHTTGGLDGNTLTGTTDFFVTRYDSTGAKQYTRQFGVAGVPTYGLDVATDTNGNIYVAGYTYGGLDGNTLTGTYDFFITKYDSTGARQYTRQLGVAGVGTLGTSVTTDTNGNVYITGYASAGLDGNTQTGITDIFLTKYDSTGVKQYTRQLGVAGGYAFSSSAATDANGNVYVAGYTSRGLDGNTMTKPSDLFVTRYNNTGVKQHTRQLGVARHSTHGRSVATDANGNVYVTGQTAGGLDGNTLTGIFDFFITRYDSTGARQYTRQLGVAGAFTYGHSVATDANGNVYVAGHTWGGLDGNTLTGASDLFVTRYDSTGARQYTVQLGVAGVHTFGSSVATDANGNVYVAGGTAGGLDGNTLTGTSDFFVTKYDSTGVKQ